MTEVVRMKVAALATSPVMQVRMTGGVIDNVKDDGNNPLFDHSRQRDTDERITRPGARAVPAIANDVCFDLDIQALEGARLSGRGNWTDEELYYILGNKLQENAARWWVQMDQELRNQERTWTRLKSALLRRYGERPDKSQVEWRVNQRQMMPGETFADFAAGLREYAEGIESANESYSHSSTDVLLVKQRPVPKTLEDAVYKATEIDDPFDNVAQGMQNIGQAWVTAPSSYMVPSGGTTGRMMLIPCIGLKDAKEMVTDVTPSEQDWANFSNPQGAWNKFTGTWDIPKGRVWNGRYWAPRGDRKRTATMGERVANKLTTTPKAEKKAKVRTVRAASSDDGDESDNGTLAVIAAPPPRKRLKAAVRQTTATERPSDKTAKRPVPRQMRELTCYACGAAGHFARQCPNEEAKARNDAYLASPVNNQSPQLLRNVSTIKRTALPPVTVSDVASQSTASNEASESTVVSTSTLPRDGSTAAVKSAVSTKLDDELRTRDDGRAWRYVNTVRPAMAALRYVYSSDVQDEDGRCGNEARSFLSAKPTRPTVKGNEIRWSEESGEQTTGISPTEEGDGTVNNAVTVEGVTTTLGSELTDKVAAELGSIAEMRTAIKQSRCEAKRQRVLRAKVKMAKSVNGADEVERAAAGVCEERRIMRQQRAKDARCALEARRQKEDESVRATEYAYVNLVQKNVAPLMTTTVARSDVRVESSDGLPTAMMMVDGEQCQIKIDSGARYSVAGTDWMMRGERLKVQSPVQHVEGIGGFLLTWLVVTLSACIIDGCTDEFLVGVDFLGKHRATIDFDGSELKYNERDYEVIIPFQTSNGRRDATVATVKLVSTTSLQRRSVQPMEVAVAARDGENGIFIPAKNHGAVLLATAVTTAKNGKILVPAVNAHSGRIRLPSKTALGSWIPVDDDMEVLNMNNELQYERVKDWLDVLGDGTTPLENEDEVQVGVSDPRTRELVLKLLRTYRNLTKPCGDCPPSTTLDVEHHIDTGTAAPIMMKRRRQAQTEEQTVDKNVDSMLNAGVIEESDGCLRKKGGEVRFCVDYRALNRITKKDVYPLPRIDETLEALGGACLFTTLDLRAGYWQIKVAKNDRDKTPFTTKRGLYRFKRMPFGLTNAPATFQRLMNGVLRGLNWTTCLVYLDDIVVFTQGNIERHVLQLAAVLERLSAAGLTLKLKKCMFAAESMEYLGHFLSKEGVRPLNSFRDPRPTDVVEIKRFVHLAGYYRKFIEAFGSIVKPMTRLLKKDTVWQWTEEQEFAFSRVKMILTTRPLLLYPNFRLPFRLITDASKVGLGACLMQDQGRGWQPIAYASKVNNDAEANYSITELECLAVVWSVKLFRPYLYGRAFTIITDDAALKWLMTRPNLAGRLHRWSLTLQEYEFDVLYAPGAINVVADDLSRAPAAVRSAAGRSGWHVAAMPTVKLTNAMSTTEVNTVLNDGSGLITTVGTSEPMTDSVVMMVNAATDVEGNDAEREHNSNQVVTMVDTATSGIKTHDAKTTGESTGRTSRSRRRNTKRSVGARRSARIQERERRRVHWAETAPVATQDTRTAEDFGNTITSSEREATQDRSSATAGSDPFPTADPLQNGTATMITHRSTGANSATKRRMEPQPVARKSVEATVNKTYTTMSASDQRFQTGRTHPPPRNTVHYGHEEAKTAETRSGNQDETAIDDGANDAPPMDFTLQITDEEVVKAQKNSKFVQKLVTAVSYKGKQVATRYGLVTVNTEKGWRVVIPPTLWSAFGHDIYVGLIPTDESHNFTGGQDFNEK
ncbi:LOW QUALITY PROTEIN: Gag-pol fusion protein [Phytophthora palmivora]|uniref:RNA-directed DNA polymerase n=1 Tax=Phytophthora palmivora TaxID=4796 RepID=A0A2P4Y744_9STRA|nr:LOW QUALITY PROTEIN: Gag-pol fusion protein [Phytophthora palmivora]